MPTKASAPAKIILLGEHAAVYGNPVLVATVDLRTYVAVKKSGDEKFSLSNESTKVKDLKFTFAEIPWLKKKWGTVLTAEAIERIYSSLDIDEKIGLDIEIKSQAPVSSGLGSSASAASALVLAISREFDLELEKRRIAKISWDIENIVHKKSSGVDPFSVTFGGVIRYQRGEFEKVSVKEYPEITIGNTGVISDTGEIVGDVMKLKENFPRFFDSYLKLMIDIVNYGQEFLEHGNMEGFGEIMNINHGLLSAIGVSSPELDQLVWAARRKSPGAKLCGAGRGGVMIALGDVSTEIEKAGGKVIKTKICDEGVRLEK